MIRTLRILAGSSLLYAASLSLSAQQPMAPPPVLRIFREDIKEGRGPAHEKTEANWAQMLAQNKYPNNSLALVSLTGPSQAWFLEAHASFASIGQAEAFVGQNPAVKTQFETLDSQDSEYRAGSRTWIAVYQPEMSFKAQQLVETLPKARYFNVLLFRVRQDHAQQFVDLGKTAVAALQKAISDQPVATYQVVSGAPNGTYILFEPTASLASIDNAPARSQAMFQAMGSSGAAQFNKMAGETVASVESLLFSINPRMSYMPSDFTAGDPEFWTPKPPAAPAKAAPKKQSASK